MTEFVEIIESIESLPFESQEILSDILHKRISERKRELFINETLESIKEIKKGNFEIGDSEKLFKQLGI